MSDDSLNSQVPRIPGLKDSMPGAAYKRGDFIGQEYEVYGVLGAGGFGIVYLVYSRVLGKACALKTFRDEFFKSDDPTRDRFDKEAGVWVKMDRHPYVVRAYWAEEVSFRLFIALEYVAPDEYGLNSLEGHLRLKPPDLAQSLRWAIQFCHGMEYAYSRGIRSHRDIKPANIMIASDKSARITDFGLAGALGMSKAVRGTRLSIEQGRVGLSCQTLEGTGFGTPTHMPPEQFTDAASCDERSDIYGFGVVLYQMASGGRLPFLAPLPKVVAESESAKFWREMHRLHASAPVPRLNSRLFPVIKRCLEKEKGRRYQSFKELRGDLKPLLRRQTGEAIGPPELVTLEAWDWFIKGVSLFNLHRYEEAMRCHERALELDAREANAWLGKCDCLDKLGRRDDAMRCCDRALELNPRLAAGWCQKAYMLTDHRLHPRENDEEAIRCYDRALEIHPRHAHVWYSKGCILDSLGRYQEAIRCYDMVVKALELDATSAPTRQVALYSKGLGLGKLGRHEEAILCWDRILELYPWFGEAWNERGRSLDRLGRCDEAIRCYDKGLGLYPRDPPAWNCKGASLAKLGRYEEAMRCFDRTLEIKPRDAAAWFAKAQAQEKLGAGQDAVRSYKQYIALAPAQDAAQVVRARQRVRELEGR